MGDAYWKGMKASDSTWIDMETEEKDKVESADPEFDIRLNGITQILIHLNPVSGGLFWGTVIALFVLNLVTLCLLFIRTSGENLQAEDGQAEVEQAPKGVEP